ncbi:Ankyrin Repeat And Socs Box Protein 14 [Manis pentadactyla]|nr:Ankyrin Repeat And Socs Box Protein 14 [Manis pentadactyla]
MFHMDNYTGGEDTDDDFDTQLTIQQSLQSLHGPGTVQQPPAGESFGSFLSADCKKIVETIATVRQMRCHT